MRWKESRGIQDFQRGFTLLMKSSSPWAFLIQMCFPCICQLYFVTMLYMYHGSTGFSFDVSGHVTALAVIYFRTYFIICYECQAWMQDTGYRGLPPETTLYVTWHIKSKLPVHIEHIVSIRTDSEPLTHIGRTLFAICF